MPPCGFREEAKMQRLGKNHGRYHGESIDIDAVQSEIHELALAAGWSAETFLDIPGIRLRAYARAARTSERNIYVASGIHGDEPSGPLALAELLRENSWPDANLWLVPCLNPTGFRLNTRENSAGIDLNRQYRNPVTPEIVAHTAWLKRQPRFQTSILLHEDWEANGYYIYELNPKNHPSLSEPIIEAVRQFCPVEIAESVDGFSCRNGIIRVAVNPPERPQWAEAIYLIAHHSEQSYTLETPSDFALTFRVKAHCVALHEAFRQLP
jgi:murein peptide amidase A